MNETKQAKHTAVITITAENGDVHAKISATPEPPEEFFEREYPAAAVANRVMAAVRAEIAERDPARKRDMQTECADICHDFFNSINRLGENGKIAAVCTVMQFSGVAETAIRLYYSALSAAERAELRAALDRADEQYPGK